MSREGKGILICGGSFKTRLDKAAKLVESQQEQPLRLEGGGSVGIDEIRELESWLKIKPLGKGPKSAIVVEAERMTREAQNAILATLEEPPGKAVIVLTTNSQEYLLPTIVSRCQIIKLAFEPILETGEKYQELKAEMNLEERFGLAEEVAKNGKGEAINYLKAAIAAARKKMLNRAKQKALTGRTQKAIEEAEKIRRLEKTRILIEKNINPRLALENLFLAPRFKVKL